MNVLDHLLENFWILRRKDRELYFEVKDGLPALKPFLEEKLGCPVIVHPDFIRLQKHPGEPESWMGIREFDDTAEYALFMLVLMFLEDKGAGEQFVLSQLTEAVESTWPGEDPLDWTLFRTRRQMVDVLRFCVQMSLISVDDGEDAQFVENRNAEVLYEATGLSRYFVRPFTGSVFEYGSPEDIQNGEWLNVDRDRGLVRRQRVYRRLLYSPAVQAAGPEDPDLLYVRNFRNQIQRDLDKNLGGAALVVSRSLAMLRLEPEKFLYRDVFPGTGSGRAVIDILLQICTLLRERIAAGHWTPSAQDHVALTRWEAISLLDETRRRFETGWSREYRTMPPQRLNEELLAALESYCLIRRDGDGVCFLPLAGRFAARYPSDYAADAAMESTVQDDEETGED